MKPLIVGSSISSGTGSAYARGWRNYYLNSNIQAAHWSHRSGNTMNHEIQIIDLSGLFTSPQQEINVQGNGTDIASGSTTPTVGNDTEFGTIIAGTISDHTFTIQNTGDATLNLTGGTPLVDISGDATFSILTQPIANNIVSGGSDLTFVVRFAPIGNAVNLRAVISIDNDDGDENPYIFEVQGSSTIDSDGDGIDDFTDIDDDNDGILDTIESTFVNRILNSSFEPADGTATSPTGPGGAIIGLGVAGHANNPVGDPGFEFSNWTIIGDIDLGNEDAFGVGALAGWITGTQFIDILGSGPAEVWPQGDPLINDPAYVPNGIEQTITTLTPGQVYQFSFDYTGHADNSMAGGNLFINGVFIEEIIFNDLFATPYTYTRNFTATGVDTIRLIASRSGALSGAPGLLVDNFQIMESASSNNTDSDTLLNHLDADSDNDGIPDLVEAGGYDTDGNGIVDVLTDSDNDGLADIYDTGSNFGNRDTDGDGILNFLDLDSDNDGIVDILEAGATDTDANGLVDGFTDVNLDGYHDSYDGAGSILITGTDGDADGIPDSYPNGNSDGTGFPDFIDIDSDDDGITDNTEAQATSDFIAYVATDSDGDGIIDIFDNSGAFGGNGLIAVDTDFDCIPDYLDTDSDDDTEDDSIEGHDTNGDGIVTGSDSPNAGTGLFTGIDTDNDGLDDGFDNTPSGISATNSNLQATSHPIFDALYDRDWRASNSPIDFDGINDYIDFGDNLDMISPFSLEAWVLQETTSAQGTILSKRDIKAGNLRGYHLTINGSNQPNLTWYNSSGVAVLNITSPYAITNNKWYHIAATYDGNDARLYIDGLEVVSGTTTVLPSTTDEKFIIGAMYDSDFPCTGANFFNGRIYEIRIWNTALTPEQIREMLNQHIVNNAGNVRGSIIPSDISGALSWSNLRAYISMDTGVADDRSNNANHGFPKNVTTTQTQSAPLPYTTKNNGDWNNATVTTPWTNGDTVWNLPNSIGIDGTTSINWNIVETSHNVNIATNAVLGRSRQVLGLIVNSGELQVNGDNVSNTGNGLTVTHYLKLDGIIDLEGESQLIQTEGSDLDVTSSGTIERDQQGTRDLYTYNYWSSPVSVSNITSNNNSYNLSNNILKNGTVSSTPNNITFLTSSYNGSISGSDISIADYWIWKYANQASNTYSLWQHVRSTGTLNPGEGFTMKGIANTDGAVSQTQNYVFDGKPNNGDINLTITAGNDYLVGNPYPSALDANEFIMDNISNLETNGENASGNIINGALYFWDHFGGGSHNLKDYQGGYATYTLMGGVPAVATDTRINNTGATGTKIPGRYIPVGQGFFCVSNHRC